MKKQERGGGDFESIQRTCPVCREKFTADTSLCPACGTDYHHAGRVHRSNPNVWRRPGLWIGVGAAMTGAGIVLTVVTVVTDVRWNNPGLGGGLVGAGLVWIWRGLRVRAVQQDVQVQRDR